MNYTSGLLLDLATREYGFLFPSISFQSMSVDDEIEACAWFSC